ncbi:MAG: response regulator [Azonexus sp.]|nr:response regulator [Azonexus sp.]MCK6412320.1 response regulator [Azonexus sp.]
MNFPSPSSAFDASLLLVGERPGVLLAGLGWPVTVRCRLLALEELPALLASLDEAAVIVVEADDAAVLGELLCRLRSLGSAPLPPLVALCGRDDAETLASLLEVGADAAIPSGQAACLLLASLRGLLAKAAEARSQQLRLRALLAENAGLRARQAVLERQIGSLTELGREQSAALRDQRSYFNAILSNLPLPVLVVDSKGCCTHWNPAAERTFGLAETDCIGRSDLWPIFFAKPTELLAQQIARGNFSPENSAYRDELRVIGNAEIYAVERYFPDIKRYLSVTASPIRNEDGRIVGAIETLADITVIRQREEEAQRLRQQAQTATESKSRFLANMSHEIRTPMNAIIGMLDLCLKTELNERQSRYLSKIKLASESLLHVINQILDFSKIEAGKLELEETSFVLENVFDQLSAVLALRAEQQGIELNYDIENDSRVLIGDPMRLGQVLINLVSNAIKFSAGGRIVVRVRDKRVTAESVELEFSVEDTGIGLAPEQCEKLFQPFSQADASTTRKYGGTGLGLAISHLIVQQMGGRIGVESELGRGSTFHFHACFGNLRPDRRSGIAALAAKLAEQRDRPVLVVDDHRVSCEILARIIGHLGLPVITADSGEAALQAVRAHSGLPFLAAFIDWKMPGINGLETIDRLRAALQSGDGKAPPMILVTAYSHHEELRDLVGRIDSLLAKPVSARQLYVELSNALGLSREPVLASERRGTGLQNWAAFRELDILVAEDIDVNREVIGELLASVGLRVRFAENGQQAVAAVAAGRPDIVLMDCQMPIMDGYEATQILRTRPECVRLPIVALTANASFEDKARCHFSGMNAHIAKPFRLEDIYRQLLHFFPSLAATSPGESGAAQQAAPAGMETMPSFAGIELALGLSQTGGKLPLYLRVLKKYRDTHVLNFVRDYRRAEDDGDCLTCIRLAHSLKGVSLILGATGVGESAAALERLLRDGDESRLASGLQGVLDELAVVATSLAALERY